MEKKIQPKIGISLVNETEGGCACQILGIECTCGEREVFLYDEFPQGEKSGEDQNHVEEV